MPNPLDDRAVYTLDDLRRWEELRPGLPPSLAVLGHPVAHSVSPQMHNAALAELAKTYPELAAWRYFKFDIEPEKLDEAIKLLFVKKFIGVNLTVPHKVVALRFVTHVNQEVHEVGAVNTLYRTSSTFWAGTITDTGGFQSAFFHEFGFFLKQRIVVLLGAGGVARSIAVQCIKDQCDKLWIANRTTDNLNQLLKELETLQAQSRIVTFDLNAPPFEKWPQNVIVINATSVGLKSGDPVLLDVSRLGKEAVVYDTIYKTTPLVDAAKKHGLRTADGLSMLVWQGASSLSIWLPNFPGKPDSVKLAPVMMNVACDALDIPRRTILP